MSDLFTIDCHACGAKNTIDTETMRRIAPVDPKPYGEPVVYVGGKDVEARFTDIAAGCFFHCTCPEPAA